MAEIQNGSRIDRSQFDCQIVPIAVHLKREFLMPDGFKRIGLIGKDLGRPALPPAIDLDKP